MSGIGPIVAAIEEEMAGLQEAAVSRVSEVNAYLQRHQAQTKLRPRVKATVGSAAFSIIWRYLLSYDHSRKRPKVVELKKGRGHLHPRSRLLSYCRGCPAWEAEYIWEQELAFGRLRRQASLLSKALVLLRQCQGNGHGADLQGD